MRKRQLLGYSFLFVLIILAVWNLMGCASGEGETAELSEISVSEGEESEETEIMQEETQTETATIFVHVCGEVCAPGVYELPSDSRVYEALEAAGGMTETADFSCLNQAERVNDGQQIYVLSKEEARNMQEGSGGVQEDDGRISLNTASKEELMTLTGIGEVKAEAIVRYREDKGGFTSVEELKEIEGIKEGVFNKVKDHIKI